MAEELTIVTRFRAEVDEQNRALAGTSTQLTALAKQLDSSVEGFDRFRSTVDGATDRLKLFGIRGQRMADAINKNIHDPIKRAQFATKLFNKEQARTPGIMDKAESVFRSMGLELGVLEAKLGALYMPLKIAAGAVLALAAAIGKKLFDATKKYVTQSVEHKASLALINEELAKSEKLVGKVTAEWLGLKDAFEEVAVLLKTVRSLMSDTDGTAKTFQVTFNVLKDSAIGLMGPLQSLVNVLRSLKEMSGLTFAEMMKMPIGLLALEKVLQLEPALADAAIKRKGTGVLTPEKQAELDRERIEALRKKLAEERRKTAEWRASMQWQGPELPPDKKKGRKKKLDPEFGPGTAKGHQAWLDARWKAYMDHEKKVGGLLGTITDTFQKEQEKRAAEIREAMAESNRLLDETVEARAFSDAFDWSPQIEGLQRLQTQVAGVRDQFVMLGSAIGEGFGAMAAGEMKAKDFGKTMLTALGQIATQWGQFFLFEGLGFSFLPGGQGFSAGLTAAGIGLTTLGGVLSSLGSKGKPAGGGGAAAAFDTSAMARDILPKEDKRQETIVQVFVAGDQIRDPLWRVVNEGFRTGHIQPAGA
jgi:hypothetical protein